MELNCLKVSEYYKDMSKEGAAYLERGIFEIEIGSHPYHLYSLSISGVMTKGTSEFSSANAPVVDFKEFRDKNIKHNLGKVLLNVLDPKFNSVSNVGEVCIYAREFADRLNSRSHPKLKGSSWLGDDINSSSDMMKRKKGSTDGFFARIKRYFSNRKRLRDANETYGDEKQKDFS